MTLPPKKETIRQKIVEGMNPSDAHRTVWKNSKCSKKSVNELPSQLMVDISIQNDLEGEQESRDLFTMVISLRLTDLKQTGSRAALAPRLRTLGSASTVSPHAGIVRHEDFEEAQ